MDCVRCGQQYEVGEQGCKPVKLDSGEVVFTDVMNLYTCKNDECELHDQTFTVHTFEK